jgi:hypothetical protein
MAMTIVGGRAPLSMSRIVRRVRDWGRSFWRVERLLSWLDRGSWGVVSVEGGKYLGSVEARPPCSGDMVWLRLGVEK